MYPILFHTSWDNHDVAISAYAACLTLATIVAWWGSYWSAIQMKLPRAAVVAALTIGLVSAICGARLWHAALHAAAYHEQPALLIRINWGAFGLHGLLLGGLLGGWLSCCWLRLRSDLLADAITLPVALALILIRLGCWLNGCCFGLPTTGPWAVTFPVGSLPHAAQLLSVPGVPLQAPHALHPTQLYEIGGILLALALTGWWTKRRAATSSVPGSRFLCCFSCYLICLWLIFPLRGDLPLADIPIWAPQSMNALLLAIVTICWWRNRVTLQ